MRDLSEGCDRLLLSSHSSGSHNVRQGPNATPRIEPSLEKVTSPAGRSRYTATLLFIQLNFFTKKINENILNTTNRQQTSN